jgi:hypothetical protein
METKIIQFRPKNTIGYYAIRIRRNMPTEYERIREKIAHRLEYRYAHYGCTHEEFLNQADQFLSIDGIDIKSDDQSLPRNPNVLGDPSQFMGYSNAQDDMVKAGFIKVIPKERIKNGS